MKTLLIAILTSIFLPAPQGKNVYEFKVKDIEGRDVSLSEYKGKVLLIVNVASMCGLTPQYIEIEALYQKYKTKGLVVLGFPANNFMGQEPGSDKEIKEFCYREYAVTFPMFSKISVKGKDIAPLYFFMTQKTENGAVEAPVKWNFQKFLVNKKGEVITSFSPTTKVTDAEIIAAVEKAINE